MLAIIKLIYAGGESFSCFRAGHTLLILRACTYARLYSTSPLSRRYPTIINIARYHI